MTLEILYFASLRERVGVSRETVASDAATVRDLIAELGARSDAHAAAFADPAALRCAVDQELAGLDAPLAGVRELAFFPPMTGG
ncbi:molybdopterin converting factor subunit 1 [Paracoccus sp. 1_MG-2023]|uniref:molybdopterin converting factor subunit 1 n=1 Tax=unclassified Paracoccus (in: a-proteobacteria) TaxID=2688777 RepID=UPI001C09598B|nr:MULTISPECIES: molybdopterin converting factor subunit 1 [unclassified Paracoccus (in: a-proteobacteria)]MBU2956352.1 molybdopterin converting factor subunit 1 [Paracoccus sp. C2R09]MDO6668028.1 molybdopterin converting factor subunit 1 [Paracoccus sp. 1_MG-2023]